MDALTFGTATLLRHMTFSEARKMPIKEINLAKALEGLELTMAQARGGGPSFCGSRLCHPDRRPH